MKHKVFLALGVLSIALFIAGCATTPAISTQPLGQGSFTEYATATKRWVESNRTYQSANRAAETGWNAPQEFRPRGPFTKGVLLVHGLGDSPWSFVDIGHALADQGYLVRTVLLPGHGTKPADMIHVDVADWRQVVNEQVEVLRKEVGEVYLGGFSTGGNLVLEYALDHDEAVSGLLLFSPAFKSRIAFDWIMPWLAGVKTWLITPDENTQQQTPVRYLNVPSNGFAQFYRSSATVRDKLIAQKYLKPVLVVAAQHDSVVDVEFLRNTFTERFVHPSSRMIWYGEATSTDPRILSRPDRMEALRISEFSHMSVLFSPHNPLYGREGAQRMCQNGQTPAQLKQCQDGQEVWYSDWGYQEPGKTHARLTFNPYFEWQAEIMANVLSQSAS